MDEHWELTDLGRQHLQEATAENAEVLGWLQNPNEGRVSDILAGR